jgi:SAM-dependent methyltransferase
MTARPNELAPTADFEFAALTEAQNYRRALLRDFAEHLRGRVLEVGAGIGQITDELRARPEITRLVSVEPDPRFVAKLRARLPACNLVEGTIDNLPGEESWDAILNVNVLEHIGDDERELAAYRRLLARNQGVLCLFVPARPEIYAPLDEDFGHFRRYTRPELRTKLEQAGFHILRLRYYNFVGYFAWWLSFCLLRQRGFNAGAVRLYDRVIFPVVHALESRVCSPPIGQSLIAMARAG